jgi:ADP-ribosylglycohydrolase
VVHLIARYENNLEAGLIQAVMAGGDSAARAMIVGMVLAAYLGEKHLPGQWVSGLKREEEILALLDGIG